MKKTLLGTTALVSAGLVAGPALASDPLTVSVSGSVITGFYFVDSDNVGGADIQDTKVAVVARDITIGASGTLDNGLVAGANLVLQLGDDEGVGFGSGSDDATVSEAYAYLEGGFGRLELGGTDGAGFKMHYSSPWFVPGNGVDSPNVYNGASTTGAYIFNGTGITIATSGAVRTSTYALITEDANKVSYFTPRLAGFQLGLSFTPDSVANDPIANGFGLGFTGGPAAQDVIDIAVNYAGELGGATVGVDVFYATGDGPTGGGDPTEYGVGASVGFGGFTVGGAYYENEDLVGQNIAAAGAEAEVWTAGVSYGTGPWTVGVAYLEAEGKVAAAALTAENSFLQIGGGYSLGAGVDVGLDVQIIEETPAGGTTVDSNSAGVVLAISF